MKLSITKSIEKPEQLYPIGALGFYLLSTLIGSMEIGKEYEIWAISIRIVSTPLWLIFGALALYFLYKAFFDMWIYGLQLIGIYITAGIGAVILHRYMEEAFWKFLIGILIEISSLLICLKLIKDIWGIRKSRIDDAEDKEEAIKKFSLGNWYIMPFIFWFFANLSLIDWSKWFDNENFVYKSLFIYNLAEVGIISIAIYILWIPQKQLFTGIEFIEEEEPELPIPKIPIPLISKHIEKCPNCGMELVIEHKKCPSCGHKESFGYCPSSEAYIINCPKCHKPTSLGTRYCKNCGEKITREILCDSCGKKHFLRNWISS